MTGQDYDPLSWISSFSRHWPFLFRDSFPQMVWGGGGVIGSQMCTIDDANHECPSVGIDSELQSHVESMSSKYSPQVVPLLDEQRHVSVAGD